MNKRFLGTPRYWWLATGVLFLIGLVFIVTGMGGGLVTGVLLVLTAIVLFAAAPMRYGESASRQRAKLKSAAPDSAPATPPLAPPAKPARPRPKIEGGDPSQV